jgi:ribosomal protein S5
MKTPMNSIKTKATQKRNTLKKKESSALGKKKSFVKETLLVKKKKIVRLSRKKYQQKVVQIKRVTKVVKGGKKMTFRAVVIIGDEKQKVGVGIGRAEDVSLAIEKAILHGKKTFNACSYNINKYFSTSRNESLLWSMSNYVTSGFFWNRSYCRWFS